MSEKPQYQFLTGLARFVFYFVLTLALFFGAAVIIFVLRGSSTETNAMPDVTGKYYVDVHEDLNGRLQLRVRLKKRAFNDRAAGLVLYQSIPPGSLVQPREKIELIVNQPDPLLKMPDLMRTSIQNAKASISRLAGDERVYGLTLGAVSEIETDEAPAGTVLAQFPLAGESVTPGETVYLLVAREARIIPAAQAAAPAMSEQDEWSGQNITILSDLLSRRKIDYRLGEIKAPPSAAENGRVFAVRPAATAGQPITLDVYLDRPEERYGSGYELLEVDLDEPGSCRGEVQPLIQTATGELPPPRSVFATDQHGDDETVSVILYRRGENRVRFVCGDEVVYERTLSPEYPG
ncbi:MAG: PASTA domain-containing protein [Leptospirales bacterium]|jgi:beta-lactam-binding protein with PASTA domain